MAWRCSGVSNGELIKNLVGASIIHTDRVIQTMLVTDRRFFTSSDRPYDDSPQEIGFNATISAPHMHGYALEWLVSHLKPGMKSLDVGCGSGYLTACMGQLCGNCYGIDHINQLVELARSNISSYNRDFLDSGKVTLQQTDGFNGLPEEAPFDAIHVGAAAPSIPVALVDQLKCGGLYEKLEEFDPDSSIFLHYIMYLTKCKLEIILHST